MPSFDKWIIGNFEKICLEIEDLSWAQEYFSGMFDISSKVFIKGRKYEGRGNSGDRNIALRKAIVEALERAVCLSELVTTNGVAAHTDIKLAEKAAFFELLERDCFLSHFLTNTPFALANQIYKVCPNALELLERQNAHVNFYLMNPTNFGQGVVVVISNADSWGCILGMAFGENAGDVGEKAFFEAFRQFFHLQHIDALKVNLSLDEFMKKKNWEFNDHLLLSLNRRYFERIEKLFPKKIARSAENIISYSMSEFSFTHFDNGKAGLAELPIHVARCVGVSSQNLLPGPFHESSINFEGLHRFTGGAKFDLNLDPHPFN